MVYGERGNGPLDERVFIWTDALPEWVREYDQNSYVELAVLIPLRPSPAVPSTPVYVPTWLQPLIDPALDESALPGIVTRIVGRFGFETIVYGTAKTKHRGGDERFFFWTTVANGWFGWNHSATRSDRTISPSGLGVPSSDLVDNGSQVARSAESSVL